MVFILSGCASRIVFLPFKKEKICSTEALSVLKTQTRMPANIQEAQVEKIDPYIQICFEEYMRVYRKHPKPKGLNLCLVATYNEKGEQEFFDLSTQEFPVPEKFKKCLSSIQHAKELKGIKNMTVFQPYQASINKIYAGYYDGYEK
jgi:hypothetical protein